jgi:hypothetical protein
LLEEPENPGLLPEELRTCWWVHEQLGGDWDMGRVVLEHRRLALFLRRESRLERATASDNGYVTNGGAAEDVEDRGRDVVFFKDIRVTSSAPPPWPMTVICTV